MYSMPNHDFCLNENNGVYIDMKYHIIYLKRSYDGLQIVLRIKKLVIEFKKGNHYFEKESG